MSLDVGNRPDMVTIGQFYGIEINDFAVAVAKTALWIAEAQMFKETQEIYYSFDHEERWNFFPLTTNVNIHEANALTFKWKNVIPASQCDYIMGNPPFIGYSLQSAEQTTDLQNTFVDEKGKPYPSVGKLDYVAGWFFLAAKYMHATKIRASFVSTNSLYQGEQVSICWTPIIKRFKVHFDFAYRTFVWDSDSSGKANVHCSIVGFSYAPNNKQKFIVDEKGNKLLVDSINPYLKSESAAPLKSRNKALSAPKPMVRGSGPVGTEYLLFDEQTKNDALVNEPQIADMIRPAVGGKEYINNIKLYCLWLVGKEPQRMAASSFVSERINGVKAFRLQSKKKQTREAAATPYLFGEIRQPSEDYLLVPRTSSENRQYVPMGFVDKNTIITDAANCVPGAGLYEFGVLTSSVHMTWMRAVCGRLKSDYRYSGEIVYNNFVWPSINQELKEEIEKTAGRILEARNMFPNSNLAALYNANFMPQELQIAHKENDIAVLKAYGLASNASDQEILALLMKTYSEAIRAEEEAVKRAARKKKRKKAKRRK